MHSDVSLRWWGAEREFDGPDVVLQPGYQAVIDYYADGIKSAGSEIRLGERVERVTADTAGSSVTVKTDAGGEYHGTHVISSLPLGVMQQSAPRFAPELPRETTTALQNIGMGLLNKVILRYDDAWWEGNDQEDKAADALPAWFFVLPTDVATAREGFAHRQERQAPQTREDAEWLLQHSDMGVQNYHAINGTNILVCFMGPPKADAVEMLDETWVAETVHRRLKKSLLSAEKQNRVAPPIASFVTRWKSDPLSCGSYSYHAAADPSRGLTGSGPDDMRIAAKPLWDGRLGFCGEHTEPDW